MGIGFEPNSDNKIIDELNDKVNEILDSQLVPESGNDTGLINTSLGRRNSASGDSGGIRSNEPIIHDITDVDEDGNSTGIFDKINLISSMIIVDYSTPTVDIELRFIQGTAKDGVRVKITPKIGRTLVIKSGGNILTSSDITIEDTEFYELIKHSETETGVSGGAYKIFLPETGSGGNVPDATAQYQHLQSDGSNDWIAQQQLEFGANSADSAQINIPNNVIGMAWRNAANDGNIELKVDANDNFVFNGDIDVDGNSLFNVLSVDIEDSAGDTKLNISGPLGVGARFSFVAGDSLIFTENITDRLTISADSVKVGTDLDYNTFDGINIDRLRFVIDSAGPVSSSDPSIFLDSAGFMALNVGTNDGIRMQTNDVEVARFQTEGLIMSNDIKLEGNELFLDTTDTTFIDAATPDSMRFSTDSTLRLTIDTVAITPSLDIVFVGGTNDIKMQGNTIFLDGDNDSSIEALTDDTIKFSTDSTLRLTISNTAILPTLDISMISGNKITNLVDPTSDQDAATKKYVDDNIGVQNEISAGDSSVLVVDSGTGAISFTLDSVVLTTVSSSEWLYGMNLDINSNDILNPANITLANGFNIQDLNSTSTLMTIPDGESLSILEGGETRISITDSIVLNSNNNDSLIFQHSGVQVGLYDGSDEDWNFTPENDFIVNPTNDILFQDGGTTTLGYDAGNTEWVLQNNTDLQINSGSFINFITSASSASSGAASLPANPQGFIRIEVGGTERAIPFYPI